MKQSVLRFFVPGRHFDAAARMVFTTCDACGSGAALRKPLSENFTPVAASKTTMPAFCFASGEYSTHGEEIDGQDFAARTAVAASTKPLSDSFLLGEQSLDRSAIEQGNVAIGPELRQRQIADVAGGFHFWEQTRAIFAAAATIFVRQRAVLEQQHRRPKRTTNGRW